MAMHLMTGEAWHRGLIGESGIEQAPWSLLVQRRDQVADAALKVHGVAAEAVIHEETLGIVIFAEEDLRVTRAVRTGRPACVFFAMTLGAALFDFEDIVSLNVDLLGDFAAQMRNELAQILHVIASVESHDIAMAFRAGDVAMRRFMPVAVGLPDFMALRAGLASRVAVVEAGAGQQQDREKDEERGDYAEAEEFSVGGRHTYRSRLRFKPRCDSLRG